MRRRCSTKECKSISVRSEVEDDPHRSKAKQMALMFNSVSTQEKSKPSTFSGSEKRATPQEAAGQKFFQGLANTYYSSQLVSEKVHRLVK